MIKRAYAIELSYEVSDTEKQQAEKALLYFKHSLKLLDLSSTHLNIMKTPFKDHPNIDKKDIIKSRAAIRRFRDQAVTNFNDFKKSAFKCIYTMQEFSSDTQSIKLIKSFITAVESLEKDVNNFVDIFDDLESQDFSKKIVETIQKIQDQCDSIKEIVDERIKTHIQSDILAKSWVDSISDELQMKITKKTPLLLELFNKRQEQLSEKLREK